MLPTELSRAESTEAYRAVKERADRLRRLSRGWDSYGAEAPDGTTLDFALSFVREAISVLLLEDICPPVPFLVATPRGGFQCEWRVGNRELELEIPRPHSFAFLKAENDQEEEGDCDRRQAIRLIRWVATGEPM